MSHRSLLAFYSSNGWPVLFGEGHGFRFAAAAHVVYRHHRVDVIDRLVTLIDVGHGRCRFPDRGVDLARARLFTL